MMASAFPGDNHSMFYKHGQMYEARNIPGVVKSEPMDDVTMPDRPVDMSMPARMDTSPSSSQSNSSSSSNGKNNISPRQRMLAGEGTTSLNIDIPPTMGHHYFPNGPYMHGNNHHKHSTLPHHHHHSAHAHQLHRSESSIVTNTRMSPNKYGPGLVQRATSANETRRCQSPTFITSISPRLSSRPSSSGFAMKGSDGKLTVPSVLKKDDSDPMFRNVDLLPVLSPHQRAKREFVPEEKKDQGYWCKRIKNNDSARRSRMKRKALEKMMESRLLELQKENIELRHEMLALKRRFGIAEDDSGCSSGSGASKESSPTSEMSDNEMNDNSSGDNSRDRDNHSNNSSENGKDGPQPLMGQEEMEAQGTGSSDDSRYNDDSRVYAGLPQLLEPMGRDRADSIGSSSSSLGSSSAGPSPGGASRLGGVRNGLIPRSESSGSQSSSGLDLAAAMRMDKSGALDLTSDHSNRSTPARDSSSPESCGSQSGGTTSSSCGSDRRFSCLSSDGSCQEESSGNGGNMSSGSNSEMKTFPLKCRWKKCVQSSSRNNSDL